MELTGRLPASVHCILELHAFQMEGAKMTSDLFIFLPSGAGEKHRARFVTQKFSRLSPNTLSVGPVINFNAFVTFIHKFSNTDTELETESLWATLAARRKTRDHNPAAGGAPGTAVVVFDPWNGGGR